MAEPWVPLPYMEQGVQHLLEQSHGGLLLKPGMRKTSITLAAFSALRELGMVRGLLVLAPLRVCYTSWPQELQKWSDFEGLSIGILHGPKKAKVLREDHEVYVLNYDGLGWLFDELTTWRGPWPFDMLVADESTRLKNTRTERFKLLKPWLGKFKRRVILTGSPTARHLLDLFGQCFVMDSGRTFGKYITHFRSEFFVPSGYMGYDWVPKPGAEQAIYERLQARAFYAHDEDWLQLPELLEKTILVELPPKARAVYDQLERDLRLRFERGEVKAANAGVLTSKCRQLANGGVFLDTTERQWEHVHEAKTEAVSELVEELSGQPALVTYEFKHDLERLQRALQRQLGHKPPHLGSGGVAGKDLRALIAAWNRQEEPVILVQPQAAALGIDGLQEAGRAVIWHSLTYNFELYDQLIRRLRRSGQRERVLVAHVEAVHTVDQAQLLSVRRKGRQQGNLFQALKDYWSDQGLR